MKLGIYKKGVSKDDSRPLKKFKSVIRVGAKLVHLGYYYSEEQAHEAFVKAEALRDSGATIEQLKELRKAK